MIKAPKFWYKDDTLSKVIAFLAYPVSIIWIVISYIKKNMSMPYKSKLKVICIGNLNIGGTGKTPFTIYTYKILKELGYKPAFLTRGYGGLEKGPMQVKPRHKFKDVGDEALLLNKVGPTIISADRSQGAKFIESHKDNYDVILMDDGLQNNQLEKNIKLLLVDKKLKFGNGFCVPAGPLREPINNGLSNIDAIILTGNNEKNTDLKNKLAQKPVFNSSIKVIKPSKIKANKFMSFCGLANPDKFNETLYQNKYNIISTKLFPDHYQYTEEDINNLILDAKNQNLTLITTEKDYVKIKDKKNEINVLSIESNLEKTDEKKFKIFLEEKLNA
jgi:tetraacyldisaccharide 4'-kinase